MASRESRLVDWGLLLGRVGFAAFLIWFHGWTRLGRAFRFAAFGEPWTFVTLVGTLGFPFPALFACLSALSESVGAFFMGLGLFTRLSALILALNMAVATFNEAHKGDPFELPGLYLLAGSMFVVLGGGRFEIGRLWRRR